MCVCVCVCVCGGGSLTRHIEVLSQYENTPTLICENCDRTVSVSVFVSLFGRVVGKAVGVNSQAGRHSSVNVCPEEHCPLSEHLSGRKEHCPL